MEKVDEIAARRFKQVREEHQFTQKQFSEHLGVKNNIADIERGRTKISGFIVARLVQFYKINPLWLYGISALKEISALTPDVSPKVVTVNSDKNENMVLVDVKAAAGYPSNVQEPYWYNELPAFNFPLPEFRNASFRGFQVQGDSMFPHLKPKEWVIAKAVDSIVNLTNDHICVVVLKDSVLVKQVVVDKSNLEYVNLVSLNTLYPKIEVAVSDIQEVWEVTSKLSFDINSIGETASMHDLQLAMQRLSNEVNALKNKA